MGKLVVGDGVETTVTNKATVTNTVTNKATKNWDTNVLGNC